MSYAAALAAWSLLHLAWQGGALLAVSLVARRLGRRWGGAPETRHRVAASLLALAAAAPVLTAVATHVALVRAAAAPAVAASLAAGTVVAPAREAAVAALFDAWYPALRWPLAAWALGALLLGARLAGGVWRLGATRWGAPGATREQRAVERRLAELAARIGVSPVPPLRWSTAAAAPMVVGVRRPAIVVPASLAAALAPDELDAVLLHELAHVRRRDAAANLAQCAVEAALWPHPAVWLLSDAVRAEREHCCDRAAVRVSGAPFSLARALVRLHETAAPAPALAVAWGGGALTRRVEELVLARPAEGSPARGQRAATARHSSGTRSSAWLSVGAAAAVALAIVGAPAALARDSEALVVAGTAARAVPGRVTTFEARDPAGPFTLRLVNGRVSSLRLAGARVPARRLRQVRDSVRVLAPAGDRVVLSLRVDAAAGEIAWEPRSLARHSRAGGNPDSVRWPGFPLPRE